VNFYGTLADLVTLVHLSYMGYVVFGQFFIMIGWPLGWKWIRNPWFRLSHLGMILIVVVEALANFTCPLTEWENDLRTLAGQEFVNGEGYRDISFTGRLLREIQFAGQNHWEEHINTTFYVAGAIILATALLVPPRFRRPAPVMVAQTAIGAGATVIEAEKKLE
jgi:hypothetical protein